MASEIPDLFMRIWRKWRSSSPVGKGDVTQEQYWILRMLSVSGPQRIKDLADRLECTPSTASVSVKRLEKAGLVSRERSRDDEREVKVMLTEEGGSTVASWRREQLGNLSALFERLDAREKRELESLLRKVAGPEPAEGPRRVKEIG